MSAADLERILKEENFFKILDTTSEASTEEIRAAYKKLVRQIHPDRFIEEGSKKRAEEAFKRVGVAFDTLRDPLMRKTYERAIGRYEAPSQSPATGRSGTTSSGTHTADSSASTPSPGQQKSEPRSEAKKTSDVKKDQAQQHYQSGRDYERKNKPDEAITQYKEAIRLDKDAAKYHSRLAYVLDIKGWTGYAQAEYKVALHFDPTDSLALKHYKPTAGKNKSGGLKFLNLFKGDGGTRIGDILIKHGHLNKEQLKKALNQQKTDGKDEKLLLGELLIRLKYIKPEHLAQALISQAEVLKDQD